MRVLLLDDNPIENHVMKYRLNKANISQVIAFNKPLLAYDYLKFNDVDLVLVDLDMPGEDGLAVLSFLKSIGYKKSVSILSGLHIDTIKLVNKLASMFDLNVISANKKPLTDKDFNCLISNCGSKKLKEKNNNALNKEYGLDRIKIAIENGEIVNYYQPQYDFKTGKLKGLEALARWNHPNDGLIRPNDFIPQIESSGSGRDLFNLSLDNLLKDIGLIPEDVKISINVTSDELKCCDFSYTLLNILNERNVEPKRIYIELTENKVYELSSAMMTNIARLRINGVGFSIDDFGSGYSNLEHLVALPFTELKIDKIFVQNYLLDSKYRYVLETSVGLAKKLGLSIVAEGVESKELYESMSKLGIDLCQGFYTSKPKLITEIF